MGTSAKVARYSVSSVSGWGDAAPTASSTWVHVPALDAPLPKLEQSTDVAQESDNDGASSIDYPTVRGSSISLSTRIHTGTKAFDGPSGDTPPTSFFMQPLLESYFGGAATTFAGTTVTSGGSSSAPNLTSVSGLSVGQAVQVGQYVAFVTGISGSTVTLNRGIAGGAGSVVYGAYNLAPVLGEVAGYHYVNAEYSGTYEGLLGPGRVTKLAIQGGAAKGGLRYAADFSADTFGGSVTPSSLTYTAPTYTGPTLVGKGADVSIFSDNLTVADLSIDFGVTHEELPATTGTNGRAGWSLTGCEPTAEFSEYFAVDRFDQGYSRSGVDFLVVVPGNTTSAATLARTSIAVWMPNAQLTVEPSTVGGQRGQKVKVVGHRPTAAQKTAGLTSPVYFSIFGGV